MKPFATALAFIIGLVFGVGLLIAGMADPGKVLGFLDLAGAWDPSLAFVMGGAVAIGTIGFAFALRHERTLIGLPMQLPSGGAIDRRLVIGSVVFGAGWGLVGFCPGPALVAAGAGYTKAMVFVVAMIIGMAAFEWTERRTKDSLSLG